MKPLYLTMSAFGSYLSKTEIDFSALGRTGIYLISGDTGSGKSTIFDAISYALYGEVSGAARGERNLRSDAADAEETYVELKFEQAGSEYVVRRSPEYQRKKLRGSGEATQKADARIILPDGSVVEGVTRVDEKVREILKIDSKRFKSMMMIAQGDFAKLLTANSADREEILRSIFDTGIFEAFQNQALERAKERKSTFEQSRERLLFYFDEAKIDDAPDKNVYEAERFAQAVEKSAETDAQSAREKRLEIAALDARRDELNAERQQAAALNALWDELDIRQRALDALDARKGEIRGIEEQLKRAAAAERVRPYKAACEEALRQRETGEKALGGNARAIDALKEELPSLENAYKQAESGRGEFEDMLRRSKNILSRIDAYRSLEDGKKKLGEAKLLYDKYLSEISRMESLTKELSDGKRTLEARREELSRVPETLARLEGEKRERERLLGELEKLLKDIEALKKREKSVSRSQALFNSLRAERDRATAAYNALFNSFIEAQAGIIAERLVAGEPCPVCGSLAHPSPAKLGKSAAREDDVEKARSIRDKAEESARNLSEAIHAESLLRDENERAARISVEHLTGQSDFALVAPLLARERAALADSNAAIASAREKKESLDLLPGEIAKLESRLSEAADKKAQFQQTLNEIAEKIGALKGSIQSQSASLEFASENEARGEARKLDKAYGEWAGALEVRKKAREGALLRLSALKGKSDAIKAGLDEQISALKLRRGEFETALRENGFADEGEYLSSARDQSFTAKQKAVTEIYYRDMHANLARRDELNAKTAGRERRPLEPLDETINELNGRNRLLLEEIAFLERRWADNRERAEKIRTENAVFSRLSDDYAVAKGVSDLVNGAGSGERERLSLVRYVQSRLFDTVLLKANQRFGEMSRGQFELQRAQKSDDRRQKFGLDLNVINCYSGKSRQASSLSGGESFMASLSLALGFADVIREKSGAVIIDCLFVDEGFGSLDPATLDTVIDVLLRLSGDDKLIGLISHVEQLRDRVYRQILVKRTRNGSTAKVVV